MSNKALAVGSIIARLEALKIRAEADKATFLSHRAIVFAARGYSQEEIAKRLQDMQDLADMMLAGLQAVIDHEVWRAGRISPSETAEEKGKRMDEIAPMSKLVGRKGE